MKKFIKLIIIFAFCIILNIRNNSYAVENDFNSDDNESNDMISIYIYDLFSQKHLSNKYTGNTSKKAMSIQGLNTLNLEAVYGNDKNYKYVWEVDEDSKDIITVYQTNQSTCKKNDTTGCICRILGISKGIGKVNVSVYEKNNEDICLASQSIYVKVKNIDLPSEICKDLYIEGTNINLPSISDVMNDLSSSKVSHPRIMTNMNNMKKIEKYITYSIAKNMIDNGKEDELSEYEKIIYRDKDKYIAEGIPDEYFDNLYLEYRTIFIQAIKTDIIYNHDGTTKYDYLALKNGKSQYIGYRLERLGTLWLLYNARNENLKDLKLEYSIDKSNTLMGSTHINYYLDQYYGEANEDKKNACEIRLEGYTFGDILNDIKANMDNVCSFNTWFYSEIQDNMWKYTQDSNFIEAGELSYVMGMAYDWIYNDLTEEEKSNYSEKIKDKGIDAGNRWLRSILMQQKLECNWCANNFGGIAIAALSIYDEKPEYLEICAKQISDAVRFIPVFLNQLYPDGSLSEGGGYWDLTEKYLSNLLSSLKYTVNTDYGLLNVNGFEESWYWPIYITGVDNSKEFQRTSYNFSDSNGGSLAHSSLLWFIYQKMEENLEYDKAFILAWYKYKYSKPTDYNTADVQDLLWWPLVMEKCKNNLYDSLGNNKNSIDNLENELNRNFKKFKLFKGTDDPISRSELAANGLMSDKVIYGRGGKIDIVTIRQSFTNFKSSFFGMTSTNSNSTHKDLDTGGFVFDALGVRWANELGRTSSYSVDRYKCYIKRAEGHNTVVINPKKNSEGLYSANSDQVDTTSKDSCDIKTCIDGENASIITLDMTNAYKDFNVKSAQRGYMIYDNKTKLLIQDEITFNESSDNEIYWFLHPNIQPKEYTSLEEDTTLSQFSENLNNTFYLSNDKKTAILTKSNVHLKVIRNVYGIDEAGNEKNISNVYFEKMPYQCLSTELQQYSENITFLNNNRFNKLAIHLNSGLLNGYKKIRIAVALIPLYDDDDINTTFKGNYPISEWDSTSNYTCEGTHKQITSMSTQTTISPKSMSLTVVDNGNVVTNPIYINENEVNAKDLLWTSSQPDIVSVNDDGELIINSYGTCEITASDKDNPGLATTFSVKAKRQNIFKRTLENIASIFD